MADHLLELTIPGTAARLVSYYNGVAVPEHDGVCTAELGSALDPRIVECLGLSSGRALTRQEIAALLSGLRSDEAPVIGKQKQGNVPSLVAVLGLDESTLPDMTAFRRAGARLDASDATVPAVSSDQKRAARRLFSLYGVPASYPIDDALCDRLGHGLDFASASVSRQRVLDAITYTRTSIGYIDLTWSADKSVSIAWALARTEAERAMIHQAHRDAVDAAMCSVATVIGRARKGKAGDGGSDPGHIAWLRFDHFTSRPTIPLVQTDAETGETVTTLASIRCIGDPQMHTHCVVPNVVVTDEGRVGGLDLNQMGGRVKELGALYQAFLARNLRDIGVEVTLDRTTGAASVAGVPDQVRSAFSKRTQHGATAARAFAREHGLDWDTMESARRIALLKQGVQGDPRQPKRDDMADLPAWRRQAAELGWTAPVFVRGREQARQVNGHRLETAFELTCDLLADLLGRSAVLDGSDARVCAARALVSAGIETAADVDSLLTMLARRPFRQEGLETTLIFAEEIDRFGQRHLRVTTRLQADRETELVELSRRAASDRTDALQEQHIDAAIGASGMSFDGPHGEGQRRAMSTLAAGGRLSVLVGVAGSGKTTLITPLVRAWQDAGYTVWGTAVAWRQTEDLAGAGVDPSRLRATSPLIKAIQSGQVVLGQRDVVVLDELSLLSTTQLLELLRARDAAGFRLAMIGDPLQCQSVDAGPVVDLLRLALGDNAIPELATSVRQQTERERTTALMMRDGRIGEALHRKLDDGMLRLVAGGRDAVISSIADLWRERHLAGRSRPNFSLTVSAPTNADARELARAIRNRRRQLGEIGDDRIVVQAVDQHGAAYEMALAQGDHVRLYNRTNARRADGSRGIIGNNGSVLTVCAADATGLHLRNALGNEGKVSWDTLADPMTGRVRLGYGNVLSIDASQGLTSTEHIEAMPAGSRSVNAHRAYVQGSRHREKTWLVTSESAERQQIAGRRLLGDIRPIRQADILDNMSRNMARRDERLSALALLDRTREVRLQTLHGLQHTHLRMERRRQETGQAVSLASAFRRHRVERNERLLSDVAETLGSTRTESSSVLSSDPTDLLNLVRKAIHAAVRKVGVALAERLRRLRLRKAVHQARSRTAEDGGQRWRRIERDLSPDEVPVWGSPSYFGPAAQEIVRRYGSIDMEKAFALHRRDMDRKRDRRRLAPAGPEIARTQVDRLFRMIAGMQSPGATLDSSSLVLETTQGRREADAPTDGLDRDLAEMDIPIKRSSADRGRFNVPQQQLSQALALFDADTIKAVCDRLLLDQVGTMRRDRRHDTSRALDPSLDIKRHAGCATRDETEPSL